MTVKAIKSANQFDELVGSGKVMFVDFYADWCGPCKIISPVFEQLANESTDKEDAEFYKLDIEDLPEVAAAYGITSIPTFHAFKNGKSIDKIVGANRGALTNLIQSGLQQF